jgi:hypothetical protein
MGAKSPTQRSMQFWRDQGYVVVRVEYWNPFARVRKDFGGFADLIVFSARALPAIWAVQVTTRPNILARLKKIKQNAAAREWVRAGLGLVIQGWDSRSLGERVLEWKDFPREEES